MRNTPPSTLLIEHHGIIGNMRSAALVTVDGTIDFFCFPAFDSPSIFTALLDSEKGGSFSIQPQMENVRCKQMYLPDTNILLTRFLSDDGVAELTDYMPITDGIKPSAYANQIIRMVHVIKGSVRFKLRCAPRFDYARGQHRARAQDDAICFQPEDGQFSEVALHGSVPLELDGLDGTADFILNKGESALFAFGDLQPEETGKEELLNTATIQSSFEQTSQYWRTWVGKSSYKGRWRETVNRSALVLKMLSSQEYGSMIAAVTFGLPEQIGGSRNWDYRYTWLRDSSFSLYALVRLGFAGEVRSWTEWMRERVMDGLSSDAPDGPLRIMYRTNGKIDLEETVLDHLAGYRNSKPVRIGNGANHPCTCRTSTRRGFPKMDGAASAGSWNG